MELWDVDEAGTRLFRGGQEDWAGASAAANGCAMFRDDDDDERCADEELSCYNCRYRRWTAESFACLAD
jgi:hypothetical protein